MSRNLDFAEIIAGHSQIPIERLWVCHEFDALDPSGISSGIVFAHAIWSGPSVVAFEKLTGVLASMPGFGGGIHVIDFDDLTASRSSVLWEAFAVHRIVPGGNGETFWIHRGEIIGILGGRDAQDLNRIETLLARLSALENG
jgi:hypothetical protein